MRIMGDTSGMLKPQGRPMTLVWTHKGGGGEGGEVGCGWQIIQNCCKHVTENNDDLVWLCMYLCVCLCNLRVLPPPSNIPF